MPSHGKVAPSDVPRSSLRKETAPGWVPSAGPGSWPSPPMETDRQETQATPHWSSCTGHRGSRSGAVFMCCDCRVSRGGEAGFGAPPTFVARAQLGMRSTLLLLPTPSCCSRLFRSGSWGLYILYLSVQNLPQRRMHTELFLVPDGFFVFLVAPQEVRPRCRLCRTAAKGRRSREQCKTPG